MKLRWPDLVLGAIESVVLVFILTLVFVTGHIP